MCHTEQMTIQSSKIPFFSFMKQDADSITYRDVDYVNTWIG